MNQQEINFNNFLSKQLPIFDFIRSGLLVLGVLSFFKNIKDIIFIEESTLTLFGHLMSIGLALVLIFQSINYFYRKEKMFDNELNFKSFLIKQDIVKLFSEFLFVCSFLVFIKSMYHIFMLKGYNAELIDYFQLTFTLLYISLWLFYFKEETPDIKFKIKE